MTTIDLTPLYRNSVGFDRLASLFDNSFRAGHVNATYPPYNIERIDEHRYAVTLAVAGFSKDEVEIIVDGGVLAIKGKKSDDNDSANYLYQGIATRSFERKFNLAEHVEIVDAKLDNGLLTIELKHELPEAMKPRHVAISTDAKTAKRQLDSKQVA